MFRLTKWYLDLVTDQGTLLIAYAASLEWAGLRMQFASTLVARPYEAPSEETTIADVALPALQGDLLTWHHDGLGIAGTWQGTVPPVRATLLDDPGGQLEWTCHLPGAEVAVTLHGEGLNGRGYAECLAMTRRPWALPLNHLRWGRYVSADHTVAWIEWRGGEPRQWIWLDGSAEPDASIQDFRVEGLGGGHELRLEPIREICDRRGLQVLSRHLPSLSPALLGPMADLRETKRLDRGILLRDGVATDQGWVIHEVVTW